MPDARPAPPVHRVVVFITVALALLMMSVDATIVATALHALQHGLHTSINWAAWTLTAYSFGFVLMLPLSGRLSERYGRRRVFLGSVIAFTGASLLCGLADDIFVLIALRAVQAAGGAGFTPSATGIVVDHFGDVRDRAVSLFGSIFPVGAMIGPIFGGLFVTYWTWRGVFFVNVPIGVVVVVLTFIYVPRDPRRAARKPVGLDPRGMLLLGVGVLSGMFAASYAGEKHARFASPELVVPVLVALAALSGFVRHIGRAPAPFLAPRLVHGPSFGPVNLFNALYGGLTAGAVALIPLYATNRYGVSALESGTLLVAEGVATIAATLVAALLLRRTGHRKPMFAGSVVLVAGLILLAIRAPSGLAPYLWVAGSAFIVGLGYGATNPASRNAGLQLEPEHAATLAALRAMAMQLGSILAVSVAAAAVAASHAPGTVQAWFYAGVAAVLALCLPLIRRVPEHHGAW